ncbi:secreted protein [Candidatus Magnetomorum sp. HK-1]|nr:secreted protein [Candidatus Magnetomorum sp. HK-1]
MKKLLLLTIILLVSVSISYNRAECSEQVLLMHMDDDQLSDSSPNSHNIILHGDVDRAVGLGKFGDAARFDGDGDYIEITMNEDFQFGTSDFTIDFWIYPERVFVIEYMLNFAKENPLEYDTLSIRKIDFGGADLNALMSGNSISINVSAPSNSIVPMLWSHIALTRKDNIFYLFLNGEYIGQSNETVYEIFPALFVLGKNAVDVHEPCYFLGLIDELRIVKGFAHWSETNFNIPTEPYKVNDCPFSFKIEDFKASVQQAVSVPVLLTNLSSNVGFEGIDLTVEYDPTIMEATGFNLAGSILENYLYNVGLNTPGKIIVSISANSEPFVLSSGIGGYITFSILSEQSSSLTISEIIINESDICNLSNYVAFTYDQIPFSESFLLDITTEVNTPSSITFTVEDPDTQASDISFFAESSNTVILPNENIQFSNDEGIVTMSIAPAQDQLSENPIYITVTFKDETSESFIFASVIINVSTYLLAGEIDYYSIGYNRPVDNVLLVLSNTANTYTVISDIAGKYTFSNVEPGSYSLITSKNDGLDKLGADDATRIRRYKVGDNVSLDCYQKIAADVSMDGTIGAVDASRVGLGSAKIDANLDACLQDSSCIHWVFVKPIQTGCEDLPSIENYNKIPININSSDITNMLLLGIRLGDVIGN